jgi:hypothetical protein
MPCEYREPQKSQTELDHIKLVRIQQEIDVGLAVKDNRNPMRAPFPTKETLDELTKKLCEHFREYGATNYSLEVQIWWRDHQIEDVERERREIAQAADAELRRRGLDKLTDEEAKALGLAPRTEEERF